MVSDQRPGARFVVSFLPAGLPLLPVMKAKAFGRKAERLLVEKKTPKRGILWVQSYAPLCTYCSHRKPVAQLKEVMRPDLGHVPPIEPEPIAPTGTKLLPWSLPPDPMDPERRRLLNRARLGSLLVTASRSNGPRAQKALESSEAGLPTGHCLLIQ